VIFSIYFRNKLPGCSYPDMVSYLDVVLNSILINKYIRQNVTEYKWSQNGLSIPSISTNIPSTKQHTLLLKVNQ